jgi:hypothetical protein
VSHGFGPNAGEGFLELKRGLSCCGKDNLQIFHIEEGQSFFLGSVNKDFECCEYKFELRDSVGNKKFVLKSGMCSNPGAWCKFPCGPCQIIQYNVKNKEGNIVGRMEKVNFLSLILFENNKYFNYF